MKPFTLSLDANEYIITDNKNKVVYSTVDQLLANQKLRELNYELALPLKGTKFSYHKLAIKKALARNNGYCPCIPNRSEDTKCPCKNYRETLECHCNLYIKV